jgi:prephenate dehydratase
LAQPNTLPDFVFQSNYALPSIDSVATFITNECHLPGMSSALEVETAKEGVDLYTLQAQHLEQTERLYLYIIDLEKCLKKAEKELKTLKIKTQ